MVKRRVADIHRASEKSIAEAIQKNVAAWFIDEATLSRMRSMGVKHVGVIVRDTGDRFVAPLESFFDHTKVKIMTVRGFGGVQRVLPLCEFMRRAGRRIK